MTEEQVEQFKLESMNHLYQLVADMDEDLLTIFSEYTFYFYKLIEVTKEVKEAYGLKSGMATFRDKVFKDVVGKINDNAIKLHDLYKKYSEGTTEKQEGKTSFESAYFPEGKNHFVLSKDDFLDIERFKARTKDFKKREDESRAQTNYDKSYVALCPVIAMYNDIIERFGYDYIINMNKYILDKSKDAIDEMAEKLKNNMELEEVHDILDKLTLGINSHKSDKFYESLPGVWAGLADRLVWEIKVVDCVEEQNGKDKMPEEQNGEDRIPEEQLKQFRIESTNHLYQLLADMDEMLLINFSSFISNFYGWIEDSGEIKNEEDLEGGIEDFCSELFDDMTSLTGSISGKLLELYEKYSEGTTEKQEEKTSFESAYSQRRKNHFVLSKEDFFDIEGFKARTEDFKKIEDESAAQTNYHKSYGALCPAIETYNDTIVRHGYNYIIDLNKCILANFEDAFDVMAEKLKNNKKPDEVEGALEDLVLNILDDHGDKIGELSEGVMADIGEHLSNGNKK